MTSFEGMSAKAKASDCGWLTAKQEAELEGVKSAKPVYSYNTVMEIVRKRVVAFEPVSSFKDLQVEKHLLVLNEQLLALKKKRFELRKKLWHSIGQALLNNPELCEFFPQRRTIMAFEDKAEIMVAAIVPVSAKELEQIERQIGNVETLFWSNWHSLLAIMEEEPKSVGF